MPKNYRGFTLIRLLRFHQRSCKGFTLVELLIVIAILATLAVVGFVVFQGVASSARDSKRRGDVDAIAKAYEANYQNGVYSTLTDSNFASGTIPQPPEGGNYYNVIASDGSGYKVCTALTGYTMTYCNFPSITCYCQSSLQGSIASGTPITGTGSEIGTGNPDTNMIANPSFETGSTSWSFYTYPPSNSSNPQADGSAGSLTTERAYTGSSSYKLIDPLGTKEVAINYSGLSFIPGRTYLISAWIYSTTTRGSIQGHLGGGWSVDSFYVSVPTNKLNQWYMVTKTGVAAGTTPVLRCGAFSSGGPGTVYCDEIRVERLN